MTALMALSSRLSSKTQILLSRRLLKVRWAANKLFLMHSNWETWHMIQEIRRMCQGQEWCRVKKQHCSMCLAWHRWVLVCVFRYVSQPLRLHQHLNLFIFCTVYLALHLLLCWIWVTMNIWNHFGYVMYLSISNEWMFVGQDKLQQYEKRKADGVYWFLPPDSQSMNKIDK